MAQSRERSRSRSCNRQCFPTPRIVPVAPTEPHRCLRLLTFNIQSAKRGVGLDQALIPVARLAFACGADTIVCLQEVNVADADADASSWIVRCGGDQPAAIARLLSEWSGQTWGNSFGSHHRWHDGSFGNCILWPQHEQLCAENNFGGIWKLDGDASSNIPRHKEGRCGVGIMLKAPPDVAVVTVHLGFNERGLEMLRELLESLSVGLWKDRTVILCGDFNTYPEEGQNHNNPDGRAGRYDMMMRLLMERGFLKATGPGPLSSPVGPGLSPDSIVPGRSARHEPCYITFPYWTDQTRLYDSHDHQLDYFFVRPRASANLRVNQLVPVAAHGISDHHGLLLELRL